VERREDRQSAMRRTITRAGNIGLARRPEYLFSNDLSLQVSLVAGARNPLNLEFVWTAA
jgi:hypothetical protein